MVTIYGKGVGISFTGREGANLHFTPAPIHVVKSQITL